LYAIPHLNTILEHSVSSGAPADTLALWARRALARVFASLQNHSSFRQALALIEANRKAGQLKSPDLNLKGLILAIRPEPAYRQHGLMILESIAREDLAIEERLALAQLYLSSDRWLECRDIMQALLVDYPTDVRLLTKYVEMLIMREEWRQLKPWLRQLEGRAPTELETVRLAALAAKGRGKERPAAAIVETLIPEGVQAADLEMVLSAAKIYEQLEMHKAAEQAYRAMADRNVQYRMNLAAYLARRGKLDEAFRLCDTLLTKDTVRQICAIGLGSAVRYVRDLTPNQQRTIEKWLAIAKREFPGSIELITQEAALLSAQEKFNEVLQITSKVDQDKLSDSQRGLLANNNAYMNMKLGRDGDSLENINLAFDLLGPRVELLDTRAMVYLSRGDYEKAIQDLKEATLFQVESGIYYFHLALAYQAKGDRGSSQRALDIASNMKFLGDNIGFSEREKYDKLKRWLRR
jgi:tetratricopeptide (TPR) repeat protein